MFECQKKHTQISALENERREEVDGLVFCCSVMPGFEEFYVLPRRPVTSSAFVKERKKGEW